MPHTWVTPSVRPRVLAQVEKDSRCTLVSCMYLTLSTYVSGRVMSCSLIHGMLSNSTHEGLACGG
jgi:hypothetical protein